VTSSTTTIRLELRNEDDHLTGYVSGGGARREFTGWIGLLAAIDELIAGGGEASTTAARGVANRTLPRRAPL
jgi:hypothetical protein